MPFFVEFFHLIISSYAFFLLLYIFFYFFFFSFFPVSSFRNSPTAVSLILASVIMKFEEFEYSTPELFRITFFVSLLILFIYLFFDVFLIIFLLYLFCFIFFIYFPFLFITLSLYLSQPIFCFFLMFLLYWY